jgi:hypothetical protein
MKKVFFLLLISFELISCSTLTKTQVESVNQFAQSTKNFSAFPSKIMSELADIRFNRGFFYATSLDTNDSISINQLKNDSIIIDQLDKNLNQNIRDKKNSEKVDITFKILDKYAQSLALLSADKYEKDFTKQVKNFGISIDSLIAINNTIENSLSIPEGIGKAVSQLVVLGGKQYFRIKQAKEIKKFVTQADTLISIMTSNIKEFVGSKTVDYLISNEEKEITQNYLSYLRSGIKPIIETERQYLDLRRRILNVRQLQKQTLEATKDLRVAHKKLFQEIQSRKKLKQSLAELQEFVEDINTLNDTVQKIKAN